MDGKRGGRIFTVILIGVISAAIGFYSSSPTSQTSTPSIPTPNSPIPAPIHSSGFQGKDFFDAAYERAERVEKAERVERGMSAISAHHLLVADKIAALFKTIGSDDVRTVVLLSPNHFDAGRSPAQVSRGTWETPYGFVRSDARAVDRLVAALPKLSVEERTFEREHGIGALTPFVARSFPSAKLVPLVLHDTLSVADANALGEAIARELPDATVIASIDMSHYLPQAVQLFHDDTTLRALANGARYPSPTARYPSPMLGEGMGEVRGEVLELEIDANRVLTVLQSVNRVRGEQAWHLTHHGSSLAMGAATTYTDNTSHILGYFTKGEPANEPFVAIHLVGDVMLDRGVRASMTKNGVAWPWEKISRFLSGSSFVVGNLEGTVGDRASIAEGDTLKFSFAPEAVAEAMKHLDLVSFANNHSKDFHDAGETETRTRLDGLGLPWFGSWSSPVPSFVSDGIAFVGYHQFKPDEKALVAEIKKQKQAGHFVLVFPHWGTEYQATPDANQQRLAQLMADAGADAIAGSHPHVIQSIEILQPQNLAPNTSHPIPVIYSLGNFVFDQKFGETVRGLTVGMTIDEKTVTLRLIPVATDNGQPSPLEDAQTQTILDAIAARSPEPIRAQIRSGIITFQRK